MKEERSVWTEEVVEEGSWVGRCEYWCADPFLGLRAGVEGSEEGEPGSVKTAVV